MKIRQILAIIGLCAWGALIVATLVVAFTVDDNTRGLFNGLIAADIIVPVLIWIMLWIVRSVMKKRQEREDYESKE